MTRGTPLLVRGRGVVFGGLPPLPYISNFAIPGFVITFAFMKKLFALVVCLILISCATEINEDITVNVESAPPVQSTQLVLVNNTQDSLLVYLTLSGYPANDTVHVKDVFGIFGILEHGLVGSFYITPGDSVEYTSPKWFSGNVGFGSQPLNCSTVAWPTGVNPFEFNLNNNQESIDISAVGGVNCILSVDLVGGPQWQASPAYPNVTYFYNDSMRLNTDLIGVFPYGCTNCTDSAGKQPCQTPADQPCTSKICNPTRAAGVHGGKVIVTFKGYTNTQICK